MYIKVELNSYSALRYNSWSGALDTLDDIENANLEDEFMDLLEEVFCEDTPTETEVNDFIWHERNYIYETLGIEF